MTNRLRQFLHREPFRGVAYVSALAILLMAYFAPVSATRFAKSDSGVFLYIGQQIARGFQPYLNAWDHKPPLIFYLDALGLSLGGGSLWGVWLLALVACTAALWLCYRIGRNVFGDGPAILGVAGMAALLMITMESGNIAEVYALPLQVAVIWLFIQRPTARAYVAIGACAALLFLLRPNLVGPAIAVALSAPFRYPSRPSALAKLYACMIAGFSVPVALCATYFALHGQFRAAYEATLLFNLEYSAVSWRARILSLAPGIRAVFSAGIPLLAGGAALFALMSRREDQPPLVRPLVTLCIVDVVIEAALSSVSGRGYLHYFMTWTPGLGLLCAYAGYIIKEFANTNEVALWNSKTVKAGPFCIAIVVGIVHIGLLVGAAQKPLTRAEDAPREKLARYIKAHTSAESPIYVWGYGPEIYVMTARFSPSRYFMDTALATRKFSDVGTISEIVRDLTINPPELVIDGSYALGGTTPPLDAQGRTSWTDKAHVSTASLNPFFHLIESRYQRVTLPDVGPWIVYEQRGQLHQTERYTVSQVHLAQ